MAEDRDAWSFGAEIIGSGVIEQATSDGKTEVPPAGSKVRRSRERT
jgi:hypothetical protein